MFKARAKKTKTGYIGIVTVFDDVDKKPLYEYTTKIQRLNRADALFDANREIEAAKEQVLL